MKRWLFSTMGAVLLLMAGCATSRIDWQSRVGTYHYDQAITELGPPDKSAQLSDGTTVAEWLTSRGTRGYGYNYPYYYSPFYDPPLPDRFLRLTFAPDGRLRDWRRVAR